MDASKKTVQEKLEELSHKMALEKSANRIVDKIIGNIKKRKGIGDEWHQIDSACQKEIKAEFLDIVKEELIK